MKFSSLWPCALALAAAGGVRGDPPPLKVEEIPSPAAVEGAAAPIFANSLDGPVWMAWAEPGDGGRALKCARFGPDGQWKSPKLVVRGNDFAISGEDLPALACDSDGDLVAAWPETGRTVKYSLSQNNAESWSAPAVLSKESTDITLPALCLLAGGDPLAVWLDGRPPRAAGAAARAKLYTRYLAGANAAFPDWLLAEDAVPGCSPEIKPLLDGGAIIGYRAFEPDGTVVARMVRLHARRWKLERAVSPDKWTPAHLTAETVRFAADGGRVGAVWFAGSANPGLNRIYGSYSPDAGARFLLPATVAQGAALAKPDIALLHDGAMVAVWLEGSRGDDGSGGAILRLRRLSPELYPDDETKLGADAAWVSGQPRIALVKDYAGDVNFAQLLLAFTSAGDDPDIHTLLVTVPEGDLLAAAADDCHCAPTPLQLLGYPMRGTIKGIDGDRNTLKLALDAVPGVMDGGEREFKTSATTLSNARIGTEVLARIDREGKDWKIFDLHVLQ